MKFVDTEKMSLQDAFKKFREKRMEQIQATKCTLKESLGERTNNKRVEWLRAKFLSQALKYLGVPYAKKYHEKGSPDYDAPLYLDCCALVRRVLKDMKNEIGFCIGRWNQAYQFDTLPIIIEKEEDMKPGDLVFISGTYFNKNRKPQKHNMVHVEIWLGDGEKTVGARYHKGRVQIHNSYKFVSKSYHSMKYHFKSIDTWLNGICRSYCSTHAWRPSKYLNHGKKSIFHEELLEESADDSDDEDEKQNVDEEENYCEDELNHYETKNTVKTDEPSIDNETDLKQPLVDIDTNVGLLKSEFFIGITEEKVEEDAYSIRSMHSIKENRDKTQDRQLSGKAETMPAGEKNTSDHDNVKKSSPNDGDPAGKTSNSESKDFCPDYIPDESCSPCISESESKENVSVLGAGIEGQASIQKHGFMSTSSMPGKDFVVSLPAAEFDDLSCDCVGECDCDCYECLLCNKDPGAGYSETASMGIADEEAEAFVKSSPAGVNAKKQSVKTNQQGSSRMTNGSKLPANNGQRRSRSKSPSKSPSKQMSVAVSSSPRGRQKAAPKFYIGGKNGVALVEKPLLDKGWQRIDDNKDLSYYLKWVECKSTIDYKSFRPGEQLVNHIPNAGCLTTKTGLMKSLHDYVKSYNKTMSGSSSKIDLDDFYPETYKVDCKIDLEKFQNIFKDGETWICKPSGLNQGKGIFLLKDTKQLREEIQGKSTTRLGNGRTSRIVSRYIENPLLLNGRKFDMRAYMLIASTTPYLVLYHSGYVRLACSPYSNDSTDLTTHLTNQLVQKKHPEYFEMKDDSVWTFEKLNSYIETNYKETKGLMDNWVLNEMSERIKEIMLICFRSVQHKLERKSGYFDLLGFDFMVDDNMKVWLIEVNVNPALFTNCESLRQVVPDIVEETVTICVEAFENRCKKRRIHPIESLKTFQVLFDEERKISFERAAKEVAVQSEQNEPDGAIDAAEGASV